MITKIKGKETVVSIKEKYEDTALKRLKPELKAAGFEELPEQMLFIALKEERILELWGEADANWKLIKKYPFTAFSGKLGPKLKEGDKQIPEGVYKIEYLNPNSAYHLSLKVNYPNAFDKQKAAEENRTKLGGDIFIHGKAVTIGCIPIGDKAIEEVFVLASKAMNKGIKVIISPIDFRKRSDIPEINSVSWENELYAIITSELREFSL
ncbi:L,D-transpeptidase family protein [Spongiivirga sp. MCCC 1A20706]|uniref:L,D-transpeptidase family protein n=1 Tax=Spongiivirga sp. MCCC 1A20706 TaxID=3160963 RepID=UPI0039772E22